MALPAQGASDWFMSVSSALSLSPAPWPTATMDLASARDNSGVGMKAPLPTLTSMTNASRPAASFLDRMEAVISGIDSTVAVTSRAA